VPDRKEAVEVAEPGKTTVTFDGYGRPDGELLALVRVN
jgi:hypothetical protein